MEARNSVRQKLTRLIKRSVRWSLFGVLGYFGILLFGLIPVNNDFRAAENGIQIYIVSFVRPGDCRDAVAVTISKEQYERLAEFVESSFRLNEHGAYLQIPGEAYSTNDAFFSSSGRYHIMNTCNSWVGRGLKNAGVKTPWFSPMPKSPTLYIENERVVK